MPTSGISLCTTLPTYIRYDETTTYDERGQDVNAKCGQQREDDLRECQISKQIADFEIGDLVLHLFD